MNLINLAQRKGLTYENMVLPAETVFKVLNACSYAAEKAGANAVVMTLFWQMAEDFRKELILLPTGEEKP